MQTLGSTEQSEMEETWKSLVFQARWQNNSFRVLILAKQGSLQLENNLIVKPFLESEQNVSSTRSHHSQGHLSDGCYNTLMFSDAHTQKMVPKTSERAMAGAEEKMQTASLGLGSSEEVLRSKTCFRRRILACQEQN